MAEPYKIARTVMDVIFPDDEGALVEPLNAQQALAPVPEAAMNLFGKTRYTKFCSNTHYHELSCDHIIQTAGVVVCQKNCRVLQSFEDDFDASDTAFACPVCDSRDRLKAMAESDELYMTLVKEMIPIRGSEENFLAKDEREWLKERKMDGPTILQHFLDKRPLANGVPCANVFLEWDVRWIRNMRADERIAEIEADGEDMETDHERNNPDFEIWGVGLHQPTVDQHQPVIDPAHQPGLSASGTEDLGLIFHVLNINGNAGSLGAINPAPNLRSRKSAKRNPNVSARPDERFWIMQDGVPWNTFLDNDPANTSRVPSIVLRSGTTLGRLQGEQSEAPKHIKVHRPMKKGA